MREPVDVPRLDLVDDEALHPRVLRDLLVLQVGDVEHVVPDVMSHRDVVVEPFAVGHFLNGSSIRPTNEADVLDIVLPLEVFFPQRTESVDDDTRKNLGNQHENHEVAEKVQQKSSEPKIFRKIKHLTLRNRVLAIEVCHESSDAPVVLVNAVIREVSALHEAQTTISEKVIEVEELNEGKEVICHGQDQQSEKEGLPWTPNGLENVPHHFGSAEYRDNQEKRQERDWGDETRDVENQREEIPEELEVSGQNPNVKEDLLVEAPEEEKTLVESFLQNQIRVHRFEPDPINLDHVKHKREHPHDELNHSKANDVIVDFARLVVASEKFKMVLEIPEKRSAEYRKVLVFNPLVLTDCDKNDEVENQNENELQAPEYFVVVQNVAEKLHRTRIVLKEINVLQGRNAHFRLLHEIHELGLHAHSVEALQELLFCSEIEIEAVGKKGEVDLLENIVTNNFNGSSELAEESVSALVDFLQRGVFV